MKKKEIISCTQLTIWLNPECLQAKLITKTIQITRNLRKRLFKGNPLVVKIPKVTKIHGKVC